MNAGLPLHKRLRNLLFLVALLAFLLSALVVGWLQFQAKLDEYATIMHAQLRVIQSLIPAKILHYHASLQQMIRRLPEGNQLAVLAALRGRLHSNDPLDIYYVLDAGGKIVQISEEFNNFLGFNPSHMEHVQEERKISKVFQSVFSKRSVVALHYPLPNGLRLIYERDIENLVPLLENLGKGNVFPDQSFFILSGEGVAAYHPDPSLVSSRHNLAFDLKEISAPDRRGLQSFLYHNQKYYSLREELETPKGWTVYLQLPARLLSTAIATSIAVQLAGMLALFMVITLLLQFVLNRFFSKPVGQIVTSLAAYDPSCQEPVFEASQPFGVLEFSQIAMAINQMASALTEANARLTGSEEQIRLLLNSTAEAIYGLDLEGRCTFCNDSFLRIMGFINQEELLGQKIHDIIHHAKSDAAHCTVSSCVAHQGYILGRGTHSDSETFWRTDGSSFPAECWSFPIRKDGDITGAVVTFLDISERKEAENSLAAEKERLAVTLRSIGDGVITTDTAGRVVLINAVAEKLTGWPQREAEGRLLDEVFTIINEKTRQPCENPVEKVLASGQIIGLENHTVLIARDGRERNIADSGAPIRDRESRTVGVVLVFRDVTDQIQMEEERLKIKKLESVGVLAGGIAHDFNNILAAILGNLNLAQLDGSMEQETRKLLRAAEKASLRARDLTRQLLTFSKGGEPVKETASIGEIIQDSASFILHGSTVACRYAIPDNLWMVDIDKGQMSQVVQNIILNASHAMPDGGKIEIRCENIEEPAVRGDFLPRGRVVKISISDTGVGIPPAMLDKIFDPYFTTKEEGSGLGLAVTYSIISKHGGHISVSSTPGQGTTFTILLPASSEERGEATPEDVMATMKGGNGTIMIMDDEEIIRSVTAAMLGHLGYEAVQARDGQEALAIYQLRRDEGRPIDLVIMDLTIPGGMGGKEAVQKILALDPAAQVIVSSGYSNDPIMADCRHYGFTTAMLKPFQMEDLARTIKQVLFRTASVGDEKGYSCDHGSP